MKKFLLLLLAPLLIIATPTSVAAVAPPTAVTSFADTCEGFILTFRPWYYGLTQENPPDCDLVRPGVEGSPYDYDISLPIFIWTIVLNILFNLFSLGGYLAIGFIIWGAITLLLARGLPDKIKKGRTTMINALIGLVISLLAATIVAVISGILLQS